MSGTSAPSVKARNDPTAALIGEPMDRASSPTSSWRSRATACSGSAKTRSTKAVASAAGNPRDR